ncbi:MAG: DUF935 family protein [Opitutales bacterium]|nr:DUF935 family protein [Opitutales bacterium]
MSKTVARSFDTRWRDSYNPLRGMTTARCQSLMESYATGQWADLMWTFGAPGTGVESTDADLMALIEKRVAAVTKLDWKIAVVEDQANSARAKAQQKALTEAYDRFDNLYEAIEAFEMAPFRGISAIEVDWENNSFNIIEPWNLVRDGSKGNLAYNPKASNISYSSTPPEHRYDPRKHWWVVRGTKRPIGTIAILKHFYTALAQRDWASYSGIYGIPGGVVIGPPSLGNKDQAAYEQAAEDIAQGGNGYLPNGSDYVPNTAARGSQPFEKWLNYLSAQLILAGTGGKLTMLNEATGLGSGNANSHDETFSQIAEAEARKISEVFQRQFDRRLLLKKGLLSKGERPFAYFRLATEESTDVNEIVDHASKLSSAGYQMDAAELSEKTGYKLTLKTDGGAALQTAANTLQNRFPTGLAVNTHLNQQKPVKSKFQLILSKLEDESNDQAIEEALEILDSMTPEEIGANDLAEKIQRKLMEAFITGVSQKETA